MELLIIFLCLALYGVVDHHKHHEADKAADRKNPLD